MTLRLLVASRSDVGKVRRGNEDAFLVVDDLQLLAVADGMGGHQAGEVASATAIEEFRAGMDRGEPIDVAITGANDAVVTQANADVSLRGMGTTITAGILRAETLAIGHVGDSRAYLVRDGEMRQLTTDHSVVAELIAAGELTEAEALVDPRRSMITRALGIDARVEVDVLEIELALGDRLLLCSDGLTTMIRDDAIARILVAEDDRERVAELLVTAANDAGGVDNITVVVADVVADESTDASADAPEGATEHASEPVDAAATSDGAPVTDDGIHDGLDDGDGDEATPAPRRWWRRRPDR